MITAEILLIFLLYYVLSVDVDALWRLLACVQVVVVDGTVPEILQFPFSVFVEVMEF